MTVVVDASVVVAGLVDDGPAGRWAESVFANEALVAPHLVVVEAANILRRAEVSAAISADVASIAHGELLDLRIGLVPYEPFADRVWALRSNVTCYDAWYVAVAEALDVPMATLDARLIRAPGPGCAFLTAPRR